MTIAAKDRIKQYGEVYTPAFLVKQMLDKLPEELWEPGKTFLDPAIGTGNFAISILWEKISRGHDPLEALKTIFGADIMSDSIRLCRIRLLKIVSIFTPITEDHVRAVLKNIIWINQETHPTGSLEYDFEFKNEPRKDEVAQWFKRFEENTVLGEIEMTVSDEEFSKDSGIDLFDT